MKKRKSNFIKKVNEYCPNKLICYYYKLILNISLKEFIINN